MKNIWVRRIVDVAVTKVFGILLGFLSGLLTALLMDCFYSTSIVGLLLIPINWAEDMICFLLAYLVTVGLICREKPAALRGFLGAVCYAAVCFAVLAVSAWLLPGYVTHPTLNRVVSFAGDILAAFVASLICIRAPKPAPVYAPYAPYGAPQPPYGVSQAPCAAPEASMEDPAWNG